MFMAAARGGLGPSEVLLEGTLVDRGKDLSWSTDNRSSNWSPTQPNSKHRFSKEPLWIDSLDNPSSVTEELIRRKFCIAPVIHPSFSDALSPSLIWVCCKTKDLARGTRIHDELQKRGFIEKNYSDALVTMYAKCGELRKAQALLDMHSSSSLIPWTALIVGYARQGQGLNALACFDQMQRQGIRPNSVTYLGILKACALIEAVDKGQEIHDEISRQGLLEHDIALATALVDMYAKCGAFPKAQSVLKQLSSRNVVSWNALITGYAGKGQGQQALDSFEQMQREGVPPDTVTYACILKACALIGAIDKGERIHDEISRQGLLDHNIALGNALVDMYVKVGALFQAHSVLEKLPSRNVISWSTLIAGYAQKGLGQQALECFEQMQREGISPNAVTYACVLKACSAIGAIDKGKQIHDEILRQGLLTGDIVLGGALVDMYAKCGALPQAQSVLEKLPFRNVISWNALIAGYAQKGQVQQALKFLEQMQHEGISPDVVTFACLLKLCSHLGMLEKGQELFDSMGAMYGLKPDTECFTCMVDLLGRAGHLVRAVEVIQEMPFAASSALWHSLLAACGKWAEVDVGSWAFEQALQLDKCDEAAYVLMVSIYAAAGMPEKAKDIEAMKLKIMEEAGTV